ncbi:MAG: hypothetical protein QOH82_4102, partial [Mycobacterium sp.]|nr:hypothetical protein [Mycobacterium sp.]
MGVRSVVDPGDVEETLSRSGIVQGVEPSAVAALINQLQPVDFP